jgi:hypothetical protein
MMDQTRWAGLTVQTFFHGYNWQGETQKLEQTVTESQAEQTLPSLLCLKVEAFFRQSNWQGLSQQPVSFSPEERQLRAESFNFDAQSSLHLSVVDFFRRANWQGQGVAPGTTAVPEKKVSSIPVPANAEIDLTDLSALF